MRKFWKIVKITFEVIWEFLMEFVNAACLCIWVAIGYNWVFHEKFCLPKLGFWDVFILAIAYRALMGLIKDPAFGYWERLGNK